MQPEAFTQIITTIFDTPQGWKLIGFGTAIGFVFAVVALSISVVSFPFFSTAMQGSGGGSDFRQGRAGEPFYHGAVGLIVAAVLAIGFLLLFVGLAVACRSWHIRVGISTEARGTGRPV